MPIVAAATTLAAARKDLGRARDLANQQDVAGAAELAAQVALQSEAMLHKLVLSSSQDDWSAMIVSSAQAAGEHYRKLAISDEGRLSDFLTGAQYFEMAATHNYLRRSAPGREAATGRLRLARDECVEKFDNFLETLSGTPLSLALDARIIYDTRLSAVNRAAPWLTLNNDGLTVVERDATRRLNCQRVVPKAIARVHGGLMGGPADARHDPKDLSGGYVRESYEWAYGGKFKDATMAEIRALLTADERAIGIVAISRAKGGHVVAVQNRSGRIVAIEGQSIKRADNQTDEIVDGPDMPHENGAEYEVLVIPGTTKHGVLPVVEFKRANELMTLFDTPEMRRGDFEAVRAFMEHGPPMSVRDAMSRLAKQGLDAVPGMENARRAGRQFVQLVEASGTDAKTLAEKYGASTKSWGFPAILGLNGKLDMKRRAASLPLGDIRLAISETGQAKLVCNVDGFAASVPLEASKMIPFHGSNGQLRVIDVLSLDAQRLSADLAALPASQPTTQPTQVQSQAVQPKAFDQGRGV